MNLYVRRFSAWRLKPTLRPEPNPSPKPYGSDQCFDAVLGKTLDRFGRLGCGLERLQVDRDVVAWKNLEKVEKRQLLVQPFEWLESWKYLIKS